MRLLPPEIKSLHYLIGNPKSGNWWRTGFGIHVKLYATSDDRIALGSWSMFSVVNLSWLGHHTMSIPLTSYGGQTGLDDASTNIKTAIYHRKTSTNPQPGRPYTKNKHKRPKLKNEIHYVGYQTCIPSNQPQTKPSSTLPPHSPSPS